MKQITQIGATVDEAISLALQKLAATREQVNIDVLQEGKKGFFGFGARPAEVRVTVKEIEQSKSEQEEVEQQVFDEVVEVPIEQVTLQLEQEEIVVLDEERLDPIEEAKSYIQQIAKAMDIDDLKIETETNGKVTLFKLQSEKASFLIGKRGQTLNALQQLTQLVLNKNAASFKLVKLDVEDYRMRRQQALEQLANRMADKAVYTRKKVAFEPMPSHERKIIHNALANRLDIETYSEGEDPKRYLVIEPIK